MQSDAGYLRRRQSRAAIPGIIASTLAGIVMGMPEVDANRVGAVDGSQGGGLTLACAALEPRVKRAASTFPFPCDYLRLWEMDSVCPPSTQFAAYNKITSKKSMLIYPDFAHENLPGAPDKIAEFVVGL